MRDVLLYQSYSAGAAETRNINALAKHGGKDLTTTSLFPFTGYEGTYDQILMHAIEDKQNILRFK